jgi:hypothetical protein
MIEFLEIRDTSRKLVGVIDDAKSIIWASEYYGAGSFEVYTALTDQARQLLQIGYFITRRNEKNAAIIEAVDYTDSAQDGVMIIARGRMLKSILDRRLAYRLNGNTINPVRISGSLASAVQGVVNAHAGAGAAAARNMGVTIGSNGGITKTITAATEQGEESSRQSSYKGLLEFTDTVLQEYECGALIRIDDSSLAMIYDLFEGADRSVGNSAGNKPLIFSQDFENLLTAEYTVDTTALKNWALIGGEGEGLARFFTTYDQSNSTGLARREVFVDASSIPRKYQAEGSETEQEYTAAEYTTMLVGQAQTDLKELITTETFTGEINLTYSPYKYGADFWLGDLVTIQDNSLGLYTTVRILKATEAQDENGYILSIEYGN